MSLIRKALPLTFAAAVGLSGCTMNVGSEGESSSGSSTQSQSSSESPSSSEESSESPSSTESPSSEESSEESSESPSSSDSPSSEGSSSSKRLSSSELGNYASTNAVRACAIKDIAYNGTARFCGSDHEDITADYKGQQLWVTLATKYEKGATYSYTVSNGQQSQTKSLPSSNLNNGDSATVAVYVPMRVSGDYKVTYKKNGAQIAEKSVKVSVD
ncbi:MULTISPECIES: hypothetical protein [Dermacoccus]|uniref:Uncharacterized protein n=2 Tax=Dermacoccus TaxID=57495 RepID=A0A417Z1G2_9MICO|nr:hypothetical protein [Dermacoccus abyssi]RHW44404.1 hypothetical protein D1832_12660 [Dermacoccus abyssi]